ncbi:MAG: hypothetical protein L0I76_37875, partial [Pseudonocardia sp.]|nr:hypothetical protein [Pseudonocardia sp.]
APAEESSEPVVAEEPASRRPLTGGGDSGADPVRPTPDRVPEQRAPRPTERSEPSTVESTETSTESTDTTTASAEPGSDG